MTRAPIVARRRAPERQHELRAQRARRRRERPDARRGPARRQSRPARGRHRQPERDREMLRAGLRRDRLLADRRRSALITVSYSMADSASGIPNAGETAGLQPRSRPRADRPSSAFGWSATTSSSTSRIRTESDYGVTAIIKNIPGGVLAALADADAVGRARLAGA